VTPWDGGGSSFDRSLDPDRQPPKKTLPEPTPTEKVKTFLKLLREKVSGSPHVEIPAYEVKFRLSREEVQLLDIVSILGVKAAVNIDLALEWSESIRLGDQYPYRQPDPSLICSIGIRDLFRYQSGEKE
jgi:hypothetical protein